MAKENISQIHELLAPTVEALKILGGRGTNNRIYEEIIKIMNFSHNVLKIKHLGSYTQTEIEYRLAWARTHLKKFGIIENTASGWWALTEKGKEIIITPELAKKIAFRGKDSGDPYENVQKIEHFEQKRKEKHYWICSPGVAANMWGEFYSEGIVGISWDNVGDLNLYKSREEIRTKMQELDDITRSYMNDSLALWQFSHEMQEGDVIFVKKGRRELIGRGVVASSYSYKAERSEFKHTRNVNWTHKGGWEHPGFAVTKVLTDITSYTEYVHDIELLFAGEDLIANIEEEEEIIYDKYDRENFLNDVFIETEEYETLTSLLKSKKNIILQGAPGVGKTFIAKRLAYSIFGVKDTSRVTMVQFHQSYGYEDFIKGFRPAEGGGFTLVPGPFYEFCKKAQDDIERDYFFIIDEINRGNLSKIFGELLMLIEKDKRGEQLRILYENELFSVPRNVHIIGLMNTADRGIAMIDYALRRRFAFYNIKPAFDSAGFQNIVKNSGNNQFKALVECVKELNEEISADESLGDGFRIGHSYFCIDEKITDKLLAKIILFELIPLLDEYWFDDRTKIERWSRRLQEALND